MKLHPRENKEQGIINFTFSIKFKFYVKLSKPHENLIF